MPYTIDCDLFLYADDTCLEQIKEELTKNFSNICEWFVNNRLSIHLGEDKTNLSFSLPKTEKGKLELWTYNIVTSKSSNTQK